MKTGGLPMDDPRTEGPQAAAELNEGLLKAISHPLRHRLLGMLDGRVASPNELARELGLPLGRVSYHIRLLHDLGAIELVSTEPRRGALEHYYRAVTRAWFGEGDWARLPRSTRRGILGHNLQQIFTWVTASADAGGFEHPTSQVLRATLELDEEGREAVAQVARDAIERAQAINEQAATRRAKAPDGPAPVATELTVLHFERHS
jgi:DNA-binding transcriptional ArsR family regulator